MNLSKIELRPNYKNNNKGHNPIVLGWGEDWAKGKYSSWEDYLVKKEIEKQNLLNTREKEFWNFSLEDKASFSCQEYEWFVNDITYTLNFHKDRKERENQKLEDEIKTKYYNNYIKYNDEEKYDSCDDIEWDDIDEYYETPNN